MFLSTSGIHGAILPSTGLLKLEVVTPTANRPQRRDMTFGMDALVVIWGRGAYIVVSAILYLSSPMSDRHLKFDARSNGR